MKLSKLKSSEKELEAFLMKHERNDFLTKDKRHEEKYKYIFKRCIDHMKKNFQDKQKGNQARIKDLERNFYEFYFKEISQRDKIDLECFYDPRNTEGESSNIPKSFNENYIRNISKSQEFKVEFFNYMNNLLLQNELVFLKQKIETLVEKWAKQLEEDKYTEEVIKNICEDIRNNKKGKLPWSIKEQKNAIQKVKDLFEFRHK